MTDHEMSQGNVTRAHSAQSTSQSGPRYALRPVNGGYKIERLTWDEDFQNYTHAGYLNRGRKFPTRRAARDYMISEVER